MLRCYLHACSRLHACGAVQSPSRPNVKATRWVDLHSELRTFTLQSLSEDIHNAEAPPYFMEMLLCWRAVASVAGSRMHAYSLNGACAPELTVLGCTQGSSGSWPLEHCSAPFEAETSFRGTATLTLRSRAPRSGSACIRCTSAARSHHRPGPWMRTRVGGWYARHARPS